MVLSGAKVWLGCRASYNNGDLIGKWVSLNSFDSDVVFQNYIKAYFEELDVSSPLDSGFPREEWMLNDWESIPTGFISEYGIDPKFWEIKKCVFELEFDESQQKALFLFLNQEEFDSVDETFTAFERQYLGFYDCDDPLDEFAQERAVLEFGEDVLDKIGDYFDYADYRRDLELNGYWQEAGHVFAPS